METDSDSTTTSNIVRNTAVRAVSLSSGDEYMSCPDSLEQIASWLNQIPREDFVDKLESTPVYATFLWAFKNLQLEHRRMRGIEIHHSFDGTDEHDQSLPTRKKSFILQYLDEDLALKIFDFLPTKSLSRVMQTCHRFHKLGDSSAEKRSSEFVSQRSLDSNLKFLRAQEQYNGENSEIIPFVRTPMLGLGRRVCVSNAGDEAYNGYYYCDGCNGNGFMFTKPNNHQSSPRHMRKHVRPLRCIISKRFSGDHMLWYMSKEILDPQSGQIVQVFTFCSDLMRVGDTIPELCLYPSQSSVLLRQPGRVGWEPLSNMIHLHPPTVTVGSRNYVGNM